MMCGKYLAQKQLLKIRREKVEWYKFMLLCFLSDGFMKWYLVVDCAAQLQILPSVLGLTEALEQEALEEFQHKLCIKGFYLKKKLNLCLVHS